MTIIVQQSEQLYNGITDIEKTDKSRLKEKIGEITRTSLNKIDKGLIISLGCFEDRRYKK